MPPINSFRRLSLFPTPDILREVPFIRPIIEEGSYPNVENYLDIHFRLLREDFLDPLRKGIQQYQRTCFRSSGTATTGNGIILYPGTTFQSVREKFKQVQHLIQFHIKGVHSKVDWKDSKRLMVGNLLIFTKNNFVTFFCATVVVRNVDQKNNNNKIWIKIHDPDNTTVRVEKGEYLMVETETFFEPYFWVTEKLKTLYEENFPMINYVVYSRNCQVEKCTYESRIWNVLGFSVDMVGDRAWPTASNLKMNESQYEAFKAALTSRLCVIQGPPGTGKTFVGLKIMQVLLANVPRYKRPIFIVSQTNHALDQFLEGILKFTKSIIRLGSSSDSEIMKKFQSRADASKMRAADVIGMTTTCAARMSNVLAVVKPKIVVIEEAAEVLEAHIVASLTKGCEQLILIGDHKQLRPNVATHKLKDYHLDLSLFERLIRNGMNYFSLRVQHRMRPEISKLIRRIYPYLEDDSSVMEYNPVNGVFPNRVFFFEHKHSEEEVKNSTSKRNSFEVDFLLKLCRHLYSQGYNPEQMTILTTYGAQVQLFLETKAKQEYQKIAGVKCFTVDKYQGEENDIILLSLVRSNTNENASIGFLGVENRVNVALSRAKIGLFIVGNMEHLSKKSSLWMSIRKKLKGLKAIGSQISISCSKHQKEMFVTQPIHFDQFEHKCGELRQCGHRCKLMCHREPHHQIKCQELYIHQFWCGHRQMLPCYKSQECEKYKECEECEKLKKLGMHRSYEYTSGYNSGIYMPRSYGTEYTSPTSSPGIFSRIAQFFRSIFSFFQ